MNVMTQEDLCTVEAKGYLVGSVALNVQNLESDVDYAILSSDLSGTLLLQTKDRFWSEYEEEADWVSKKLLSPEGSKVINLLICNNKRALTEWVFASECCKVAQGLDFDFSNKDVRIFMYKELRLALRNLESFGSKRFNLI